MPVRFDRELNAGSMNPSALQTIALESGRGVLRASSDLDTSSPGRQPPPGPLLGASGSSGSFLSLRVEDLVFSGPAAEVETSLHFLIDSSANVLVSAVNDEESSARIEIQVGGALCDSGGGGGSLLIFEGSHSELRFVTPDGAFGSDSSSGFLDDITPALDLNAETELAVGRFTVPTGVPVQLEFWISTSGGAVTSGGTANAAFDFIAALGFADGGPVFDLPAGFSANSAEANIVANQVPEPSSWLMAICALTTVAVISRRRSSV